MNYTCPVCDFTGKWPEAALSQCGTGHKPNEAWWVWAVAKCGSCMCDMGSFEKARRHMLDNHSPEEWAAWVVLRQLSKSGHTGSGHGSSRKNESDTKDAEGASG